MQARGGYKPKRKDLTPNSAEKPQKRALMSQHSNADTSPTGTVHNTHKSTTSDSEPEMELDLPLSNKDTRTEMESMMYSQLEKLEDKIDVKDKSLCSVLVTLLSGMTDLITKSIREELIEVKREKDAQIETIRKLETRVMELTNIVAEQDMYSKRCNLIVSGVPTNIGDKPEELLTWFKCLCTRLTERKSEINWMEPPKIKVIHRLGRRRDDKPRDVIIQFDSIDDKKTMYRARFDIQKCHPDYKDIFIQGHYNKEINDQRKVLKAVADEARIQYPVMSRNISVYDNILYFGKQRYKIDSLHLLPSNLQPIINGYKENAQVHVFFTKRSPLSNHHPTPFKYDGKEYTCGEQFFMYTKAMRFDDTATAAKIMNTPNPVAQKALGRDIKGFNKDIWHESCRTLLTPGLQARFEQHPQCKQALINTGKRQIGEATKEAPWGIGHRLSDPESLDPALWRDANIMGKILETIRDNLSESTTL